jgi:hypothetical protein
MVMVNTSESSIMPVWMSSQLAPPSTVSPRQVPGPDVDDVRVHGVDGHRLDVAQLGLLLGGDALPVLAAVERAEDAADRARHQDLRVRAGLGEGAHRLPFDAGQEREGLAAVLAARDPAAASRHLPEADEHRAAAVDDDLVEARPSACRGSASANGGRRRSER